MKTNSILKPAHPENQICSDNVRISILEPRLIRFEWSKNGLFEDRKTQNVTCRNFGAVHFSQKEKESSCIAALRMVYFFLSLYFLSVSSVATILSAMLTIHASRHLGIHQNVRGNIWL